MTRKQLLLWTAASLIVAGAAALAASGSPDGLEWVAEKFGFIDAASEVAPITSPLPDYTLPGIEQPFLSTFAAGIMGIGIILSISAAAGWLLRRRGKG